MDYSFAESFAQTKLRTETELNPKSEVTFWIQSRLSESLSENFRGPIR